MLNECKNICIEAEWSDSYLKGRTQTVRLGRHSAALDVSFGVPQGLILGPLLFLIYVNGQSHVSNCKIIQYADPQFIHSGNVQDIDAIIQSTEESLNIAKWCFNLNGLSSLRKRHSVYSLSHAMLSIIPDNMRQNPCSVTNNPW